MSSQPIIPTAMTETGQLIVASSYRIYPARWAEACKKAGSLSDHFSITVQRAGVKWIIPRGQWRYSPVEGGFIAAHTFGPETYIDTLDEALTIAAELVEKTTNMHRETFSQVAARVLDQTEQSA